MRFQHLGYLVVLRQTDFLWFQKIIGSVYFTSDILAATDRLKLLCRQSKIRSPAMMQNKEKGHFVRKMLSCSWCNG